MTMKYKRPLSLPHDLQMALLYSVESGLGSTALFTESLTVVLVFICKNVPNFNFEAILRKQNND